MSFEFGNVEYIGGLGKTGFYAVRVTETGS